MTKKLIGKVALITGASAGIGHACARALAGEGAQLVLTARRHDRLDALKQEIEKLGAHSVLVAGDARQESTAIKTVEAATKAFGQIDILINNAGAGNYKNLIDTSPRSMISSWIRTFVQLFCSPGTPFQSCSSKGGARS